MFEVTIDFSSKFKVHDLPLKVFKQKFEHTDSALVYNSLWGDLYECTVHMIWPLTSQSVFYTEE